MLTDTVALVQLSDMDTDSVLQMPVNRPLCMEIETVWRVQSPLRRQSASNRVYHFRHQIAALAACQAGAGVEAARLYSHSDTPVNTRSAVREHNVALPGASSGLELVLGQFHPAVHTTHSPALLSTHRAVRHMCSPVSAQLSC